jgi:TetR/AcrR family transcriptional repressor of nem operon
MTALDKGRMSVAAGCVGFARGCLDPALAAQVAAYADRWCAKLAAGLHRMRENGLLRPEADPDRAALAVFAPLQGGLLVMQSKDDIEPLAAALDGALIMLRTYATDGVAVPS